MMPSFKSPHAGRKDGAHSSWRTYFSSHRRDGSREVQRLPLKSRDTSSHHDDDDSTKDQRPPSAHSNEPRHHWPQFRSYAHSRGGEQHRSSVSLRSNAVYNGSHSSNASLTRSYNSLHNIDGNYPRETSLWDRAYDNLKASEDKKVQKLMNEYEALLLEDLLPHDKDLSGSHPQTSTILDSSDAINAQRHSLFDRALRRAQLEDELKRGKMKDEIKGKIIIRGHVIDIQSYIVNIATGLEFATDWIGQAVGAPPGVSVAWAVMCLGLKLFKKGAQVDETNREGLAYVSSRMQLYIALEQLLFPINNPSRSEAAQEEIRSRLVELYERILDFQIRSIVRFRRRHFYEDAFGKDNWLLLKSAIQALDSSVCKDSLLVAATESSKLLQRLLHNAQETQQEMMAVNRDQLEVLQSMGKNSDKQTDVQSQILQKEEERYQETRERACMEVLRLDPRYEDSKELIDTRVEGTCCWFLDQPNYKNWLSKAGGCLLVTADPGCGKSVLTKYILEHELPHEDKNTNRIACYFFFKEQTQNTFAMALSALLHQLLGKVKNMFMHILPLHKSDGSKMTGSQVGLSQVLTAMLSDPKIPPVTFLLDALDECRHEDMEKLLAWIAWIGTLKNIAVRHRFFLTGRPYDSILQRFKQMKSSSYIHIPGNDSSKEISKEVDIVIRYHCQKLFDSGRIYEDTRHRLEDKLLAQPNSTYLFVHLVFDLLKRQYHGNLTPEELEEVLEDLPDSLDEIYDRILSRNTKDNTRSRKNVLLILRAMLSAHRPLTIQELQCVIKMHSQYPQSYHTMLNLEHAQNFSEKLRNWCGLFVRISDEGQVSFIHQTAREFLLLEAEKHVASTAPSRMWAHSISLLEAHTLLATVCMNYLSLKDFGQTVDSGSLDGQLGETERYPFLNYAARQWNYHFIEGFCDSSPEMADKALELYSDKNHYFSNWFDAFRSPQSDLCTPILMLGPTPRPLLAAALVSPPIFRRLFDLHDSPLDVSLAESAFRFAIDGGHEESAQLLLEHGVDPNLEIGNSCTALFECVSKSLKSAATCLLENGADIDINALCLASRLDDTHFLEVFIRHDVDVNATDTYGCTPLLYAAQFGKEKAFDLLLKHGADISISSRIDGPTIFWLAAEKGSVEIMQLLLDRDINHDIDVQEVNEFGSTPLIAAASTGNLSAVQFLLQKQAEVNTANTYGSTALMCAANRGHYEIVQVLLAYHADIELRDMQGKPSLHHAAWKGHDKIVEVLLRHNANVNNQDEHGCNILLSSAQYGHFICVQMLLQHGADPNVMDADGDTAMLCAAMNGHHEVVSLLLAHKAVIAPGNFTGNTALHLAAEGNSQESDAGNETEATSVGARVGNCIKTMQILLDAGAEINATNRAGLTPLMQAVSRLQGHRPILEWMLARGATVNVRDKNGCTPMHHVHSDEAFQVLVENGLDVNEQNISGQVPLQHILLKNTGNQSVSRIKNLYSTMVRHGVDLTIENNQGLSLPICLDGGFSFSSQDISLDDEANLTATCSRRHRLRHFGRIMSNRSTMNLNTCLKVEDGHLKWAKDGDFSASSREIRLLYGGKILQSQVLDDNGAWKLAYIWLDERIINGDGELMFLGLV